MKTHVVSHVGVRTLVQREPSRVCLLLFAQGFRAYIGVYLLKYPTYNKRKTFGLVWDVQGLPARIDGRPTSSAGFPLEPAWAV